MSTSASGAASPLTNDNRLLTKHSVPHATGDPNWASRGACIGSPTEWFFPGVGQQPDPRGKALCARCPVAGDCFDHGQANESFGVWGGITFREARSVRRHLAADDEVLKARGTGFGTIA